MIERYKGRRVDGTKKVSVYWNLHKQCFSVRQGGLVVGHVPTMLMLRDVDFVVNAKGRDRVRRERRKNVHAYVRGYVDLADEGITDARPVTYNPYINATFVEHLTLKCGEVETPVTAQRPRVLLSVTNTEWGKSPRIFAEQP